MIDEPEPLERLNALSEADILRGYGLAIDDIEEVHAAAAGATMRAPSTDGRERGGPDANSSGPAATL